MLRADVITPLPDLLRRAAERWPDKNAFSDPTRSVTYSALERRTARLAGHLADAGVTRGDHVLLFMESSVSAMEGCLGIVRAGGIAVFAHPETVAAEFIAIVDQTAPVVILTDACFLALVQEGISNREKICTVIVDVGSGGVPAWCDATFEGCANSQPTVRARDDLPLDSPAWLLYTIGHDGRTRGVVLSQRNLLWVIAAGWIPFLDLSEKDRVLNPLSLSHAYPLAMTLAVLACGGSAYLLRRFSVAGTVAVLASERPTVLLTVPTTLRYTLSAVARSGILDCPLKCCVVADPIVSSELISQGEAALGVPVLQAYGSTETSTTIAMESVTGTRMPDSCGIPVLASAVRIVDPSTRDDVPRGEEGILIIRAPSVMLGYHQAADLTSGVVKDGWYWTGDLARQDEHGYLTVTSRRGGTIIRGGQHVSPTEIEDAVSKHPSVLDCAVIGQPDSALGEVPVLFTVLRTNAKDTREDILSWCEKRLSSFKVPTTVHFIDVVPRGPSGELNRAMLRAATPGNPNNTVVS